MEVRPIDANALLKQLSALNSYDSVLQAVARIDATPTLRCAECQNYDAAFDCRPSCENCERTLSLNTLRDEIYEDAVAHGLWEDADKAAEHEAEHVEPEHKEIVIDVICSIQAAKMVQDEAYELLQAARGGLVQEIQEELADVVIMCMSVAGKLGIDIDAAVKRKMEINKGRAWKHGKG